MGFLHRASSMNRFRITSLRIPRTSLVTKRSYSNVENSGEKFSAPQSVNPSPAASTSSPILPILGFTIALAGSYVGGLFAGEQVPAVKKFYDEYLPFTNEARGLIGLNTPSKELSFGIKLPDPKIQKEAKPESPAPPQSNIKTENAPIIPREGIQVVITEAKTPEKEEKEQNIAKIEQEAPLPEQTPPMNSAENQGDTAPLLMQDETFAIQDPEKPSSSVSPAEAKVETLIQEIDKLNKEIEKRNQVAVTEILEKSKQNLQLADETIKGLQSELEDLLKKSDSVLTSTRTQEIHEEIEKLRTKLVELSADKLRVEEHFKEELEKLHQRLQKESQDQVEALQEKHKQELRELAARHDRDLAHQYRTQENLYNLRVKEELQKQEETLDALFKEEIDVLIRKERSERMSIVEKLSATAKSLEQIARKQSLAERENASIRKVLVAVTAFQEAVENKLPFNRELRALKLAAVDFPLIQQILDTVDESVAERGIPTPADLTSRFVSVKQAVGDAAYVSPTGGMWSFATSWVLSKVSLPQTGLVEGEDATAILARAEHHIHAGDFESATRELNQLRGWQKKLAKDWIVLSRHYLEVHHALSVIEAEIAHQLL